MTNEIKIKDRTKIIFELESGKEINVCIRQGKLSIEGESTIIIEPIASNNIKINIP